MAPRRNTTSSIPPARSPIPSKEQAALEALANASPEDEVVTDEEELAAAKARDELRRGELVSHAEVLRRLGT